jgi:phosphoribosylanthranilate isomerase
VRTTAPPWIKICGLTSAEAVAAACAAGANAIGFVCTESVRRISLHEAERLARDAPREVLRVAVTRAPAQALVDEIAAILRPDYLQAEQADFAQLVLPHGLRALPVLRFAPPAHALLPDLFLFEGAKSGVGARADWPLARELARAGGLILAGGLDAGNVGAALKEVRPYGIDASSSLESVPGRKDPQRIRAFIAAARRAALEGVADDARER